MQVQLDIRTGHAQTVDKVLGWLDGDGGVAGTTVCDCGCGTGSLAVPLALRVRPCPPCHGAASSWCLQSHSMIALRVRPTPQNPFDFQQDAIAFSIQPL